MTEAVERTSTLDDESLAMLLEEVSAMVSAGNPLLTGLADLDRPMLKKLRRASNQVLRGMEQGRSAAESIAVLSKDYNAAIRVAMELMASSGSIEPIHEAIRLIRDEREERRRMRFAMINPSLNVIVAACVCFFVMPWILVSMSESEPIKSAFAPSVADIWLMFARNFLLAAAATVVVVGAFFAILYWGFTKSTGQNAALRNHAVFCRWLAIQLVPAGSEQPLSAGSHELGSVIKSASEVVGPKFSDSWSVVVDRVHAGAKSLDSLSLPVETPDGVQRCLVDLVGGGRAVDSIEFDLRCLSELYTQQSKRHRVWLTDWMPRWVSWILMLVIMAFLLRTILMPLTDLASEVLF